MNQETRASLDDAARARMLALAFAKPGKTDDKTRCVAAVAARLRATAQAYITASQFTHWEVLGVAVALLVSVMCMIVVSVPLDTRYLLSNCVTSWLCATGIVLGAVSLFGYLVVTLAPQPQFDRALAPKDRMARLLDDPVLQAQHDKYQRYLRNPLLHTCSLRMYYLVWYDQTEMICAEYDALPSDVRDNISAAELEHVLCLRVLGRALSII